MIFLRLPMRLESNKQRTSPGSGRRRGGWAGALWSLALVGCGGDAAIAPVSGVVTLNGQPLVDASVTTQPIAAEGQPTPGIGSWGRTDAEGRYQLELVEPPTPGAVVGRHRVTITRNSPGGADPWSDSPVVQRDRKWPAQYTDGSLVLEVPPEGLENADFNLTLP
jgi:hypothetical protein